MFHKLSSVSVKDGYVLDAVFQDGSRREYDVGRLFTAWPVFKELTEPGAFERVRVDIGGYGVVWNDRVDLSAEDIYEFGKVM